MATLIKTSVGGINLDQVTDWEFYPTAGMLQISLSGNGGQHFLNFVGAEAERLASLLESLCTYDPALAFQK